MSHVAKVMILKHCDIEPSYNCVSCFKKLDARRICIAQRKHLEIPQKDKIVKNKEKRKLEESFVLLEILLRCCPGIRDIYILLRPKKGVDPQSRTKELFNRTIFNKLKKDNPDALKKVHVTPGDISKPGLGMCLEDMQKIMQEVSIVFHCAASISFLKPLRWQKCVIPHVLGVSSHHHPRDLCLRERRIDH
ncbi:putative fatty acyl-CoA reductase CG5065 [Trichonephila clavipes]|nr:putative fatty acyl-CoA reductase CG5065 [Trichonephila clavipes]